MEVATRLVDSITDRFLFLAGFPFAERVRERDFAMGSRSFPVGEYIIIYRIDCEDVLILRVVRGTRDIEGWFGH